MGLLKRNLKTYFTRSLNCENLIVKKAQVLLTLVISWSFWTVICGTHFFMNHFSEVQNSRFVFIQIQIKSLQSLWTLLKYSLENGKNIIWNLCVTLEKVTKMSVVPVLPKPLWKKRGKGLDLTFSKFDGSRLWRYILF